MIYEFVCDTCGRRLEIERPMAKAGDPVSCPVCTQYSGRCMRRLYTSATIVDEIRGRNYFHPTLKREVQDHGKYFDVGMGQWVFSKSDRRKKMAALGLQEWGPRMV